jgi:hypothetical protein
MSPLLAISGGLARFPTARSAKLFMNMAILLDAGVIECATV